METKRWVVRPRVQTGDMAVEGVREVPADGYRGRLLDHLSGDVDFLALTDVLLWSKDREVPEEPMKRNVIFLRRSAIQFAIPLHDRR